MAKYFDEARARGPDGRLPRSPGLHREPSLNNVSETESEYSGLGSGLERALSDMSLAEQAWGS